MVTEKGVITSTTSTMAWVRTMRSSACEACEAKGSCTEGAHGSKEMFVQVENTINARTGDQVIIGFQTAPLLKLSFLLYVFPVILLIIGAGTGQTMASSLGTDPSLTACLAGFAGFGIAFAAIRVSGKSLALRNEYKPFLIRISRKTPAGCSKDPLTL
ncbi:MAG: SoxR reducing system RseC family protein [Pseudomonadota bacterium]